MTFNQTNLFRDCPWCGLRDAQFLLMTSPELVANRHSGNPRFWTIANCPRCGGIVVMETLGAGQPDGLLSTLPETGSEIRVEYLPGDVKGYYQDAIRALEAGIPDHAAVGLRKTLEAAAAHFDVKSGPLVERIEKLIDKGLVTKTFGEVLTHVRLLGNVGAHAGDKRVNENEARRALRFTTQVLRNLFEIPEQLKAIDQGSDGQADEP